MSVLDALGFEMPEDDPAKGYDWPETDGGIAVPPHYNFGEEISDQLTMAADKFWDQLCNVTRSKHDDIRRIGDRAACDMLRGR